MERPAVVRAKAPSPTPEVLCIPGALPPLATCPAKTAGLWCANIVTPAFSTAVAAVYSQTIPPPPHGVRIGTLSETPSAALAWASVGQIAAPAVTAAGVVALPGGAVVADGAVADGAVGEGAVAEEVGLAVGLLLPDPQAVRTRPVITAPAIKRARLSTTRAYARVHKTGVHRGSRHGAEPTPSARSAPAGRGPTASKRSRSFRTREYRNRRSTACATSRGLWTLARQPSSTLVEPLLPK